MNTKIKQGDTMSFNDCSNADAKTLKGVIRKKLTKKDMELSTMWTISTAHLSKADKELLESHIKHDFTNVPLLVLVTKYGFIVKMLHDEHDSTPFGTQLMEAGFSDSFAEIFCLAIKYNVSIVGFDCDGAVIDGVLPTYEW